MIQKHWHLLPCHAINPRTGKCTCRYGCKSPGKHPRTRNGVLGASNDPKTIMEWIKQDEFVNLGVRTGPESGIWILDVDFKSPQHIFPDYEIFKIETLKAETPRGWHFYFNWPEHCVAVWNIRNRAHVWPGIDVRATNGYCILPLRDNGYKWHEVPIADAPQWLLDEVIGL